jgi:putative membrane protein
MIQYDPHRWLDHFFDVRGTLLKEIMGRVLSCVIWSALVVFINVAYRPVGISVVLHSLVGVALGLLLVFRTNASYDRYWEGRKLWGGIVNEARNLIRSASVHLVEEPELLERLTKWTAIFPWAVKSSLRGEVNLGPLHSELSPSDLDSALKSQHLGLYVAQRMTFCLQEARLRGLITDIIYSSIEQNIQQLVDFLGGCERIRKTPIPFAYVVHLRRALVIYCFSLPFALVDTYGWFTVLDVTLVAYTFFGIEEIGVEIEGPFGDDENDLPMGDFCNTIQHNVLALAQIVHSEREILPPGL